MPLPIPREWGCVVLCMVMVWLHPYVCGMWGEGSCGRSARYLPWDWFPGHFISRRHFWPGQGSLEGVYTTVIFGCTGILLYWMNFNVDYIALQIKD